MTETDALIRRLAAEFAAELRPAPMLWPPLAGAAAVLLVVVLGLGLRPDLAAAAFQPAFLVKLGLGAVCMLGGHTLASRLARPDAPAAAGWWLAAVVALLALGCAVGAAGSIPAGGVPLACVAAIVGLALAPLAAAFLVLRRGASTSPWRTGAAAGLLAGGVAVLGYTLSCPIDNVALVAAWYGTGILAVSLLGGVLGQALLRW